MQLKVLEYQQNKEIAYAGSTFELWNIENTNKAFHPAIGIPIKPSQNSRNQTLVTS